MPANILIVDDDAEFLEILRENLSAHGFAVSLAKNGSEFRDLALETRPDLIILDIMLGDANGVHVYERLLAHGFDSKVPVIFLSSLAKDRPPSPAAEGRLYALHSKPIHLDFLVQEITRLLKATG